MNIVNPIPSNMKELLAHYDANGHLTMQASLIGQRSVVYRIKDYSLKVYSTRGKIDGEIECEAISTMQNCAFVPKLYAYSSGKYVLTQWVEALNLRQYRDTYGHIPPQLMNDILTTEIQQIRAGFQDWDVIQYENLLWTKCGDVKRTDFWLCEPIGSRREAAEEKFNRKIQQICNQDWSGFEHIHNYFNRHGLTSKDMREALDQFLSHRNGLSLIG
ncbi:hypothetical protein [Paenibacillus tundrae]